MTAKGSLPNLSFSLSPHPRLCPLRSPTASNNRSIRSVMFAMTHWRWHCHRLSVLVLVALLAYGYLSIDFSALSSLSNKYMAHRPSTQPPPTKAQAQDSDIQGAKGNMHSSAKDSSNAKLTAIVHDATTTHTATVIFMHGFGDSGAGWVPVGEQYSRHLPHVKFIFPNAPPLAITANGGMLIPAWYDLDARGISITQVQDEKGMQLSRQKVMDIVNYEIEQNKIPAKRIVVGGFSQGCVLGLLTALTSEHKFAGVVGLSGYMPLHEKIMDIATQANRKTPIFWGHGGYDQVVKYEYGEKTVQMLQDNDYNVQFHTYPRVAHSVNDQELQDILSFLQDAIPEVTPVTAKM